MVHFHDEKIINSPEYDDIIGRIPIWFSRQGSLVIFLTIIILLSLCFFIEFPNTVQVPVTLTLNLRSLTYDAFGDIPTGEEGNIQKGQKVLIKLREFPFKEFGLLNAKVSKIITKNSDSLYLVQLLLTNGLVTSLNRTISLGPIYYGTADIITEERTLIQRSFAGR